MDFQDLENSADEFAKMLVGEKEAACEPHHVDHDGYALVYGRNPSVNAFAAVWKAQGETMKILDTVYGPMYSLSSMECKLHDAFKKELHSRGMSVYVFDPLLILFLTQECDSPVVVATDNLPEYHNVCVVYGVGKMDNYAQWRNDFLLRITCDEI